MKNKSFLILGFIIITIILVIFINQILVLRKAHSSFENYYTFRGCVKLLKKTPDSGLCKIKNNEEIKIIKFNNKWYLNGDLPFCISTFCF